MKPICRCNTTNPLQDDLAQCYQLFFHEIISKTILTAVRNARTTDTQREFFSKIPNFLAWDYKFGRKVLGHLGYFWPCPCCPFINHYFYKKQRLFISKSQKFIWEQELNLGRKELGMYLVIVCPQSMAKCIAIFFSANLQLHCTHSMCNLGCANIPKNYENQLDPF